MYDSPTFRLSQPEQSQSAPSRGLARGALQAQHQSVPTSLSWLTYRHSSAVLESISDSTSSSLRRRLQRCNPLPAITIGHSENCTCQVCSNRRYNLMNPMERGEV
ncbi:hypothetical protein N7497_003857 [Penicillium chrysogenum]|nr:hypothetical protein N7497_003857 [Penicillium chrysogenum]